MATANSRPMRSTPTPRPQRAASARRCTSSHRALGAKIVPFAGYEMPVQYPAGITAEHRRCASACGVFDVSHMGEFVVARPAGAGVREPRRRRTTSRSSPSARRTTPRSCNERGTIEDDCLVYRLRRPAHGRRQRVEHATRTSRTSSRYHGRVRLHASRTSATTSRCSPCRARDAEAIAAARSTADRPRRRSSTTGSPRARWPACRASISRTGYTGEDGFELYCRRRAARRRAVGRAPRDGPRHAVRPRRARHAAARDGDGALRQRHRRHHDAARGEPRLGGEAGQGRLRRPRGARGAEGGRRAAQARRLHGGRARDPAPRLSRCSSTARRAARCAAAR